MKLVVLVCGYLTIVVTHLHLAEGKNGHAQTGLGRRLQILSKLKVITQEGDLHSCHVNSGRKLQSENCSAYLPTHTDYL